MATVPDHAIRSLAELRGILGEPAERAVNKETPELTERAISFIANCPFLVPPPPAPAGPPDAPPRGAPPGFARFFDETPLAVPESPGTRRFDGVENIVDRPGVGLLFVIPGIA